MTMEPRETTDTSSTEDQSEQWRDEVLDPPKFIETKNLVPLNGDVDSTGTAFARRIHSSQYFSYIFIAFLFWLTLSSIVLISRVQFAERDMKLEDGFLNSNFLPHLENRPNLPGKILAAEGAKVNFPIIMIPGFVTSGLELWEGNECAEKYFRQRLWGDLGTARGFFTETDCWIQHLMLDSTSGMDPPNIRVRAAQGFEAADYFMPGYWVWGKMIKNLAAVGYDSSTMSMEPYDWRLSYPLLEKRDGYFTKLMHKVEAMHKVTDKKSCNCSSLYGNFPHDLFLRVGHHIRKKWRWRRR